MRKGFLMAGVCGVACVVASACLERPVTSVEPHTTNLFVAPIRNEVIDKLDLLFMIDNSQSMGDKQTLLAQAVPQLVDRLVVPRCVDSQGGVKLRLSLSEACPPGMAPEFRAVRDIHVAVITSSLGAHGAAASSCNDNPQIEGDYPQDRALLLPSVRPGLASYNGSGFLAWDPDQKLNPAGEVAADRLGVQFGEMVKAAGEAGCGYESSLEAWYRFLIDPEPPKEVVVANERSVRQGTDEQLLAQRKSFLRPDSLVTVVMLTDENDCSIRDDDSGYLLANTSEKFRMVRANSACERNPNDPCCAPCISGTQPGCPSVADDPACKRGNYLNQPGDKDDWNLRCWEQKRRFGYDFLYPVSRYVDGLTKSLVPNRAGVLVPNPLFAPGPNGKSRDKGLVYLAGIVGVPWQDIADDASRTNAGLRYLTAQELSDKGRWQMLLGDPNTQTPPTDPFMRESVEPRSGTNPITGDAIAPATSMNPRENAINGHEQVANDDDLQYACTFQLPDSVACTADKSCDCVLPDPASHKNPGFVPRNRPLCQPPGGGPAGTTQYFGKAYPGSRPLEVLKGIADAAIVASICPKVLTPGQPGYGYEPAVDAIVDRLKVALTGRCLPRPLQAASDGGQLPCVVVEANPPSADGTCNCNTAGRSPTSAEAQERVRRQLAERGECGGEMQASCSSFCLCELAQSEGPALTQCLNDEAGSDTPGYCYVDPFGSTPRGNPALVANCEESNKRLIRFVGPNTPAPGATAFIACLGAPLY